MAISPYFRALREVTGSRLLLLPGVAAVIHNDQGKILLQLPTGSDTWSLPAGALEPGETPSEGIVREVYEETGLLVHPSKVLAVLGGEEYRTVYPNGDQVEYMVTVFACVRTGGIFGRTDDETADLAWFHPNEMPPLPLPYPPEIFRAPGTDSPVFI